MTGKNDDMRRRTREEEDAPPDREGIEGLEYVTGEPVYHSLDERLREEQQREIEQRAWEERIAHERGPTVGTDELVDETIDLIEEVPDPDARFGEPGLAEEEIDSAREDEDELSIDDLLEERPFAREEPPVDPEREDVDVQGRSTDNADRDWQGDPWDDPGRGHIHTERRRR